MALRRILRSNRGALTDYIDPLAETLPDLLDTAVPLHVIQLVSRLWSKIEILSPRKLYVLSKFAFFNILTKHQPFFDFLAVAALLPTPTTRVARTSWRNRISPWRQRTSHAELCKDPLIILRCDDRVFR